MTNGACRNNNGPSASPFTRAEESGLVNVSMLILSVQLALYALAWLAVGWTVRLHHRASHNWAMGWFCSALATFVFYWRPPWLGYLIDLVNNALLMAAFIFLYRGTAIYARKAPSLWVVIAGSSALLLVEVMRLVDVSQVTLRVWLLTVGLAAPMAATARLLWQVSPTWLGNRTLTRLILTFPPLLTIAMFGMRAVIISLSAAEIATNMQTDSARDAYMTIAFLTFLGLFNFSLFMLVFSALVNHLETLSSHDQLTGLKNRRAILELMRKEHARFLRTATPYSLIMIDIDHFKAVNDQHGHLVGDEVLHTLAQRLKSDVRGSDSLARLGGEEFLLLLPASKLEAGHAYAQRLRESVEATPFSTAAGDLAITISLGVAQSEPQDSQSAAVMGRADQALYQAKGDGRNCVR
jgi:diguanylate cyclase (GGDEF)-like protein